MKYLFFLIIIFSTNLVSADIYKCNFSTGEAIVKIQSKERGLAIIDKSDNINVIATNIKNAEVVFIPSETNLLKIHKGSYEAFAVGLGINGDDLQIVFFESNYRGSYDHHSITIKPWKKNSNSTLFNSKKTEIFKGDCK